ncbi:MAG: LysR substrate-binding domain-containing protein [Kiloniellales bacterium]|nr:LysR substrate-binding domain-containing protein [Kiloniellales bacterium]
MRVTTTDTLIELLTPLLVDFRGEHPGITLELATSNDFFTLTRRDADVAIRPAVSAPEELVARRIAGIAFAPFAAPAYLESRGAREAEAEELEALDWLGPDDSLAHLGLARWLRARVPAERIVFRASSLLALREAARAGLGVAPLPCYLAATAPELRRVAPPLPEMASALWLITHPDLRRSARVRAFLDFMGARLTTLRGRLEAAPS